MKINFHNRGQGLIGIIIVLVVVGLIGGGLYYYLSKQIPEVPEISEKPKEEVVPSEEITPPEEVGPPKEEIPTEELKPEIICQNECSPTDSKKCSNNGYQICGNYDADACLEWSSVTNCPQNTICQNGNCVQQRCTDGTLYGKCSTNKPKYCSGGVLIDKASVCGCDAGYVVEGDKCIKKNVKYEPIIFALNKSFAGRSPDWKQKADALIDKINFVFNKTTNLNFTISKYLTYEDSDYTDIFTYPDEHSEYYIDLGDRGGISYILLIHEDGISNQGLKELYGSDTVNVQMTVYKGGKRYELILDADSEGTNILYNPLSIPWMDKFPVHELGHCFGLGAPEWYFFKYSDCTHLNPKFGDYNIQEDPEYKDDPMAGNLLGVEEMQFNEVNSIIINKNLNRQFSYEYIQHNWFSKVTKVHVTDEAGNSIQGATVKVFCAKKGCFYCSSQCGEGVQYGHGVPDSSIPLQTLTTDVNGYVIYEGPVGDWEWGESVTTPCIAKAIKVYFNGKGDVRVVNFLDLQKNYILNNSNEHIIHIILE